MGEGNGWSVETHDADTESDSPFAVGGLAAMSRGRGTLHEGLDGAAMGAAYGGLLGAAYGTTMAAAESSAMQEEEARGRTSSGGGAGRRPLIEPERRVVPGGTGFLRSPDPGDPRIQEVLFTFRQIMAQHGTTMRPAGGRDVDDLPTHELTAEEATKLPDEHNSCVICMEQFKGGDTIKRLPCLHGFHKNCIESWLERNGTCPVCKHRLDGRRDAGELEGEEVD